MDGNIQMMMDWRGYWVATPTPFTLEGAIDLRGMESLLDLYISQGVHGIVVNGSTGEWCSQDNNERKIVAALAVKHIAGRIPCVVGISSYTPKEVIDLAQHAKSIGACGVMITPPPYYNLTEDEIFNFYSIINSDLAIPIMIYNWPRGVGVDMSENLLIKLTNLSEVVAIKESSGSDVKTIIVLKRLIEERKRIRFFARFIHPEGSQHLQEIGGDGNIDGGGLGAPFAVRFFNSWWMRDSESMKINSVAYANLSSELINTDYSGKYGSPIAQLKACMRILNQPGGFVRPPLMDIHNTKVLSQLNSVLARNLSSSNI